MAVLSEILLFIKYFVEKVIQNVSFLTAISLYCRKICFKNKKR